ncbi:hypothetical protein BJ546DRAFT_946538 [Cryomyces antarcticus]
MTPLGQISPTWESISSAASTHAECPSSLRSERTHHRFDPNGDRMPQGTSSARGRSAPPRSHSPETKTIVYNVRAATSHGGNNTATVVVGHDAHTAAQSRNGVPAFGAGGFPCVNQGTTAHDPMARYLANRDDRIFAMGYCRSEEMEAEHGTTGLKSRL